MNEEQKNLNYEVEVNEKVRLGTSAVRYSRMAEL